MNFQQSNEKDRQEIIKELYANRRRLKGIRGLSLQAQGINPYPPYEKYYGGYQSVLDHYFRHLFQSYKYLSETEDIAEDEKYFYGKLLRSQLSTYEQALLFVSSISCLGLRWELSAEIPKHRKIRADLITRFNLVKNLPGNHLYGIKYRTYYKNVQFEAVDPPIS